MKWTALNVLGGLAWLAGLSVAKGANLPGSNLLAVGDHQMLAGFCFGILGLLVLLWSNIGSEA